MDTTKTCVMTRLGLCAQIIEDFVLISIVYTTRNGYVRCQVKGRESSFRLFITFASQLPTRVLKRQSAANQMGQFPMGPQFGHRPFLYFGRCCWRSCSLTVQSWFNTIQFLKGMGNVRKGVLSVRNEENSMSSSYEVDNRLTLIRPLTWQSH